MGERLRCQLYVWRHRDFLAGQPFGHADCVDRYVYLSGLRAPDDGRPLLRHLCLRHLRASGVAPLRHHLQPPQHQGVTVVDCHGTAPSAACRVRQVRHSPGHRQVHVGLWLHHEELETLCRCLRYHLPADALHHRAARDGFRPCLPVILPHALSGGNARIIPFHRTGNDHLLRCRHQVRGGAAVGYAYVCGQVRRPAARPDILHGHGMGICGRQGEDASAACLRPRFHRAGTALLRVRHSV